ncbi:MAG TPA: hypothetical protein VJ821_13725 [Anaerolineales bacterium]|nr:hypothetical protein [Anaerolineales bacterium]
MPSDRFLLTTFLIIVITACSAQIEQTTPEALPSPTNTNQPATIQVNTEVPITPNPISCDDWQSWPVVPAMSRNIHDVYEPGQAAGNDPRAFSKIGDGEIAAAWFFTVFDLGEDYFDLGSHRNLLPVIEHFDGSFERIGMAARRGFNTNRILDSSQNDPILCESGESPLDCELRLHRPAFAILSLGTNQAWQRDEFEAGMRQILDTLLSKNIVPILSTKGDNLEGDHSINRTIACLAVEYDVPLWNFWSAIQPLPNHGLQADLEHLTYGINDFDDAAAMQSAWTVRNLTALQALDAVWRAATSQP